MLPSDTVPSAMPRVGTVAAIGPLRIRITWSAGPRAGSTEELDLSPIINAVKFFRPLRKDAALFTDVQPIAHGTAIAWGQDEAVDLSATALLRLAEETMRPNDMRAFIARQGFTETSLAATLDYSRRQIVGFINEGRPIPRVVSLACRYIELQNPTSEPASPPQACLPSVTSGLEVD